MRRRDGRDELVYLDVEDALEIFAAIIGGTPEQAADQLRSRDALARALGRPANYARDENADLPTGATDRELADWIITFSAGAKPHEFADLLRPRLLASTTRSQRLPGQTRDDVAAESA